MLFSGKTLLVLGTNVGSIEIVNYAKKEGAYTIVTDNLPEEKSKAKKIADLALGISTDNIEELTNIVKHYHVDGVIAGISEFNLVNAIKLSERCGLHFYCDSTQWYMIENKDKFRELCEKCEVPVPKTFFCGEKIDDIMLENISYPVVIKPVDSCASQGVYFCQNKIQLREYFSKSIKFSSSRKVIIEQYIEGDEFTAHYTIVKGKPYLSSVDNRYPVSLQEGDVTTIPLARVYPSTFLDDYIDKVDEYIKRLCININLNNAVMFVQGIRSKKGEFYIFEAGLRSAAEMPSRFLNLTNGVDYMKVLVEQILLNKVVSHDGSKENPNMMNKICAIVSFASKGGIIGKIEGLEDILNKENISDIESRYSVGAQVPTGNTLRQIVMRFLIICNNREELKNSVRTINKIVDIYDENGIKMIVKMDENTL